MKKCKTLSNHLQAKYIRHMVNRGASTEAIKFVYPDISEGSVAALRANRTRRRRNHKHHK